MFSLEMWTRYNSGGFRGHGSRVSIGLQASGGPAGGREGSSCHLPWYLGYEERAHHQSTLRDART